MSPAALLAELRARGVELAAEGDSIRYRAPRGALTPDLSEQVRAHKPALLALLRESTDVWSLWPATLGGHVRQIGGFDRCAACGAGTWARYADVPLCQPCASERGALLLSYREALHRLWRLTADGEAGDPAECREELDTVVRLVDDVGESRASALRERWEQEWQAATGRCPRCGLLREHHA